MMSGAAFKCVNIKKTAGPDGISGWALKLCADQLVPVFTMIFNLSPAQSVTLKCLKKSTIMPVPMKTRPACLNGYRPVALTSVVMKCTPLLPSSLTLENPRAAF